MTDFHELCLSSTCNFNNKNRLPIICSLLILSPYLFKFIYFISPLLYITIPTLLLLICIFDIHHKLLDFIQTIRPKLIQEDDEEEFCDFEIYNIVYYDHPPLINSNGNTDHLEQSSLMENPKQRLFEELDRFDDSNAMPDTESYLPESIKSSSGDDENTLKSSSSVPGFDSYDSPKSDPEETQDTKTVENFVKSTSNSMRVELDSWNSRFGSYVSMRKLKGWKCTFTCKLFEARCSLCGGGEGMESSWEAYEEDTTNKISRSSKKKKNVKNNKSKSEFKYFDDGVSEDGDKDDQFMGNGQLCCFKALKMSTGKMNLGMGKPNLVKISKALKGFGASTIVAELLVDRGDVVNMLEILTTAARPFSIFDRSNATKAKKQDDCLYVFLLTGTRLQNNVEELWIFSLLLRVSTIMYQRVNDLFYMALLHRHSYFANLVSSMYNESARTKAQEQQDEPLFEG
ncbi:hypothetical protein Tco_0843505 [Tanacetum coccineum]|uniref:Uncharacterized protein n=1 Tax=Tanacetum coccineum TaxID=301880 RepID=A0ABQ5B5J5_9ASTR